MNGKAVAYRLSKVSLNALTRIVNDELKAENVIINRSLPPCPSLHTNTMLSMCPGSVQTDMNPNGPKTADQGTKNNNLIVK